MVPRHAAQHADMRMVEKYLRPLFHNGSRVFIAFQHYQRGIRKLHRLSKTRHFRTYQVVEFNTLVLQYMHDHRGNGGFAMAASHYHSFLILAHLVYILRERVDRHSQGLCRQQLRIIALRMHAQYHRIQVFGYLPGMPAKLFRQ